MTAPPETPEPTHLRRLAVDILRSWSPEQALAAFEIISELRDAIWTVCGCRVQDTLRHQCTDPGPGHWRSLRRAGVLSGTLPPCCSSKSLNQNNRVTTYFL
jgi:hypothetical protein